MSADKLTHLNDRGEANMVDVSDKAVTTRTAEAEGFVIMQPQSLEHIYQGTASKGDVLATARLAAIMAAKRTHELIPLCHPLSLSTVSVDFETLDDPSGKKRVAARDGTDEKVLRICARVKCDGRTGVEMEALTAVSVACLTIYDMLKAIDRTMYFSRIRLVEKTGGRSGHFRRTEK
jgi:cyclic pyranopterin phosphate synthase